MQPKPNLPLGPDMIPCSSCNTRKEIRQTTCPNCGVRSCPKGHLLEQSARICPVCGWEDPLFKQTNLVAGSPVSRSRKNLYSNPEFSCPQCQRTIDIVYDICPHCGALLGNVGQQEKPSTKATGPAVPVDKLSSTKFERPAENVQFADMPDRMYHYCKVCRVNTRFVSGKCNICGNLLDTAMYVHSRRQSDDTSTGVTKSAPLKRKETPAAEQPEEPLEGEGAYICPICRTTNEKSTDKCPVCGYIGPMQYERTAIKTQKRAAETAGGPSIERSSRDDVLFPAFDNRDRKTGQAAKKPASDDARQDPRSKEPLVEQAGAPSIRDDTSQTFVGKDLVIGEEKGAWFGRAMMAILRNRFRSESETGQDKAFRNIESGAIKEKSKEWMPPPEPALKVKSSEPKPVKIPRSKVKEWNFPEKIRPVRSSTWLKRGLKITGGVLTVVVVLALAVFGIYTVLNNRPLPSSPASPVATPPGTQVPVIENIAESSKTDTGIAITWQTDLPATGQIEYGMSSEYGEKTSVNTELSTEHSITLNGLSSEETYHYRVISTSADGSEAISTIDRIFTTLASPDVTPPVIAKLNVTAMDTSAIIEWTTDEPTGGQVEYGSTVDLGTSMKLADNDAIQHRVVLSGLKPQTTYYFQVRSSDINENETVSDQDRFVTLAPVTTGIEVGDRAPDFTLDTIGGDTVTLSALRGKLVMVNFWTTGCGACVAEMPDIQAAYESWSGEKDLEVLAVNSKQPVVYVQRFLDERAWCTLTIPLDTDGAVAREYHITRIPRTFFIDGTGIIRKVQQGRFQDKEEIMAVLDELD